jgi:hypothetical protein
MGWGGSYRSPPFFPRPERNQRGLCQIWRRIQTFRDKRFHVMGMKRPGLNFSLLSAAHRDHTLDVMLYTVYLPICMHAPTELAGEGLS